jgi:hypothetical protein
MTTRKHRMTFISFVATVALLSGCDSGTGVSVPGNPTTGGSSGGAGTGGRGTDNGATGGSATTSSASMGTGGRTSGGAGSGAVGTGGGGGMGTGGKSADAAGTGGMGIGNGGGTGTGGRSTGGSTATSSGRAAGGSQGTGGKATGGTGGMGTGGLGGGGWASGGAGTAAVGTGGTGINGTGGAARATGGAGAGGSGGSTGTSSASCLDGITSYASSGPFGYSTKSSGRVNMWIPKVPAGCKVPMVHYSNGTGATCSFYTASLVRLASNGFLALCYEDTYTGAGKYGIEAFKTALSQYPDLADYKFGSTGHSQGGMASLVTLQYAEAEWGEKGVYAGLAIEPASGFGETPSEGWETVYGKIKSPAFLFSGLGTDTLVSQSWVQQAFDALSKPVEAYFWAKRGANHLTTVNQDAEEVLVSWFRWKLLGDQKACQYWKAIPTTDSSWTVVDKQNEVACN